MFENQASGILAGHPQAMEGSGGFVFPSFGLRGRAYFLFVPTWGWGMGKQGSLINTPCPIWPADVCDWGGVVVGRGAACVAMGRHLPQ